MKLKKLLESKLNRFRPGLQVYYWRPSDTSLRNFGDEITPIIVEKIWGIKCHWTRLADCKLVGAGSVLELLDDYGPRKRFVHVWGSGYIKDGASAHTRTNVKYSLVRGPLTGSRIGADVPYGDPGLLASKVFQRSSAIKHKVGVVLHMKDMDSSDIKKMSRDVFIISPYQSPQKVAQDITSCEIIFSSSLHGLIFADSFNIPNFRLKHNELEGQDYKFRDYYKSTGRSESLSYSLTGLRTIINSESELRKAISKYRPVKDLSDMQNTIINTFPFKKMKKSIRIGV